MAALRLIVAKVWSTAETSVVTATAVLMWRDGSGAVCLQVGALGCGCLHAWAPALYVLASAVISLP